MCNRPLKCLIVLACLAAGFIPAASFAQRVDLNENGMSDIWDLIHNAAGANPNSDSDGDGVINGLEAVAGTDPFDATSLPSISLYARSSTNFSVSLWSALGKRYELQSVTNIAGSNWVMEANTIARTGTVVTLTAPATSTTKFFKVLMADVDTDGDGVNDWEEYKLGLDPLSPTSNGTLDSNGQPSSDFAFVTGKLAAQNVVTISASTPTAVQPDVGQAATSLGAFNITRGGFPLNEITVNLGLGGPGNEFAVKNLDHEVLLRPVTLPAGVGSVNVPLVPLANANRKTSVVAMLKELPGAGYAVGISSNASVVIYPSPTPAGTGLTAQYFNNASSTYANTANFSGASVTRVDPKIDFSWGTNSPASGIANTTYSVRWTGQIQPQYSEPYTFVVRSDDGAKLG